MWLGRLPEDGGDVVNPWFSLLIAISQKGRYFFCPISGCHLCGLTAVPTLGITKGAAKHGRHSQASGFDYVERWPAPVMEFILVHNRSGMALLCSTLAFHLSRECEMGAFIVCNASTQHRAFLLIPRIMTIYCLDSLVDSLMCYCRCTEPS